MCRWIAYSGEPLYLEELVVKTEVSLIDQSLSARRALEPTNGDGFGLGWYGRDNQPGRYRSTQPAWNDANLRDLAGHVQSHLFLAHVRRSTGSPVQSSNCHPFRYRQMLFVHNGEIEEFDKIRWELATAIRPDLYAEIGGTTDSEVMFYLALTFGLEENPIEALEKMAGFVEKVSLKHGIKDALQMSIAVTNGQQLWAARYSTVGKSRTLYHSASMAAMNELYPGSTETNLFQKNGSTIVSEPLSDVSEMWVEIPEGTALEVSKEGVKSKAFAPR